MAEAEVKAALNSESLTPFWHPKKNVYLIESKWDNHRSNNHTELMLRPEQTERHEVFRWYLSNWSQKYSNEWEAFTEDKGAEFVSGKDCSSGSLLAMNLQQILSQLHEHCPNCANVKNVLLFFHGSKSKPPNKIPVGFEIVPVLYDEINNYVDLEKLKN